MEKEFIDFAKWFIHTRRKTMRYEDKINAVDFASNLMSEICCIEPFATEHYLLTEYKKYKNENI